MEHFDEFKQEIAPFFWVEMEKTASVCLYTDIGYLQDVFDTRAGEGFLGNGYDWASLAQVFLAERRPDLQGRLDFDPEAGMFCAYSEDKPALAAFIRGFKGACGDRDLILELFGRAELD